jgi:hypothetical protein
MAYTSPYTGTYASNILLKMDATLSDNGKVLYIKETTGDYDVTLNPGGWETPNPARSAIEAGLSVTTGVRLEIQLPGETEFSYGLDIAIAPFMDGNEDVYSITTADIGLDDNLVFPDGMYYFRLLITYDTNGANSYAFVKPLVKYVLLAHNAKCCVYHQVANTTDCECGCEGEDKSVKALQVFSMYKSMLFNAAMGKVDNVNKLLTCIQTNCDCGC